MITLDDVNEIVAGLTYKPNWTIDLEERWGAISLVLRMHVPDATKPAGSGEMVEACGGRTLDLYRMKMMSRRAFLDWVFEEIMAMERHEAQEWFRLRGELVRDPHAERGALVEA